MAEIRQKRPRGRPRRDPVDALKTKVWYAGLLGSASISAYMMERLLLSDRVTISAEGSNRPGLMDRYRDGTKVPRDKNRDTSIIQKVEGQLRGSSAIFKSPIWDILKGKSVEVEQIYNALEGFGGFVEFTFLEPPTKYKLSGTLLKDFEEEDFRTMVVCSSFQVLQAVIMAIYYFQHIVPKADIRNRFAETYRAMIPDLVFGGEVPFYHEVFDLVDGVAARLEFRQFSQMELVRISWRDVYPDLADLPAQQTR